MNNTKRASLDKIIVFKTPLSHNLWLAVALLFYLYLGISNMCSSSYNFEQQFKHDIILMVIIIAIACVILYLGFKEHIYVDLKKGKIVIRESSHRTVFDLDRIAEISVITADFDESIISIRGIDFSYDVSSWKRYMLRAKKLENSKERYQKFADQVNAIIRERYPDNKPINYDESDE